VSGEPPPDAVEAALQTLAEGLMRTHPEWEVRVLKPGEDPPPGSVVLPAACEDDVEAILGRPVRKRRGDDNPVD
jgi:hypothetical protein